MDSSQDQRTEKGPRVSVDDAPREDLVKQVKRQLALLQKAKAKCDDLGRKCQEKDKAIDELQSQCKRWEQEHAELEELRQAYHLLQDSQEKQYHSFEVFEEKLAASSEDVARWRHKYQECLEKLECTESKMAAYTQGTECLQQELQRLEAENRAATCKVEELTQSQKQLQAERAALQQQLGSLEQEKRQEAGSEAMLEISQGHLKQKIEELLSQCKALQQERDACSAAQEALAQQAESASEEAASLRQKIAVLLEERSSLENQRDEKMNECNLLQEEKHGLERQVSDLYQTKEELEAKEKEFAKILDDNSSLEKLLAEAVSENTQLQERVNYLQEKIGEVEAEKQNLAAELETATEVSSRESLRFEGVVKELENKLAWQKNVEHELQVSRCQQVESEKLIENLKAALAAAHQQQHTVEFCAETKLQDLPRTQTVPEEQLQVLKQEKDGLITVNQGLEMDAKIAQAETAFLEEKLAQMKKAYEALIDEFQISVVKVLLLEKELSDTRSQKEFIMDELREVEDVQHFLEDEGNILRQECEELNARTGRLEADLENDRIHILKLEHEREAAEWRDQQSQREVEKLRAQLKEVALDAWKCQEVFQYFPPHFVEPRLLSMLKVLHRTCRHILETADQNLIDVHVDDLLPEAGAALVPEDFSDDSCWEDREKEVVRPVPGDIYEDLKEKLRSMPAHFLASIKSGGILQHEKQDVEEEVTHEGSRKDWGAGEERNGELAGFSPQIILLLEERIGGLETQHEGRVYDLKSDLEQKRRELMEMDESLRIVLGKLSEASERYTKLKSEHVALSQRLREANDLSDATAALLEEELRILLGKYEQLVAQSSRLEIDLKEACCQKRHFKFVDKTDGTELTETKMLTLESRGVGTEEMENLAHQEQGQKECDDSAVQEYAALQGEVEKLRDENKHLSEECSSLAAALDSSKITVEELSGSLKVLTEQKQLMEESHSQKVSLLEAEVDVKAQLLDQIHGKLDDQLEQFERLEALLNEKNKNLQDVRNDTVRKDSELESLRVELSHLRDQLVFYENECARLRTAFQPESGNENSLQDEALCEWYNAHRTMLRLLSQLVMLASRQQHPHFSFDGHGDSDVLSEARCLYSTLSAKLESVCQSEEDPPVTLSCIVTKAIHKDLVTELALMKSVETLLDSLSSDVAKATTEKPLNELEECKDSAKEISELQKLLMEKDELLKKFRALILKLKKEVADKTGQIDSMEEELSSLKQEVEKNVQASKQSVQNFQSLQNEYDKLQDQYEAIRSNCKELEGKLSSMEHDLAVANRELSDAGAEKEKLKEITEYLNLEIKELRQHNEEKEAKLILMESQARLVKELEEKLLGRIKVLEEQAVESNKQLLTEKEQHASTAAQLEKVQKESKMHTLLNLEIADYERTVAELNNLLKERNEELDSTRKESLSYQSKIANLVEHIGYLEGQKKADDERLLAFKETIANLKEGLSKSRKHEEDLLQTEVRLESEVKAAQLREQDLKLGYAELLKKCQGLESSLRSMRENYQRAVKALEGTVASLKEELSSAQAELQACKVEFENYKVRVHTVLKQQKKSTAGAESGDSSEAQEKLQGVVEQMRQKIRDLTEQLELSQSETEAARDQCDRLTQRHQAITLELEARETEWKHRLEEAIKQNTMDMSLELDRQLQRQYEELSDKYKKKLTVQEAQHCCTLELQMEKVEELKREIAELQQKLLSRQGSPQEETPAIDIATLERQEGEGSESISPEPPVLTKPLPWSLVPTGGFKPLEQLLREDENLAAEDLDVLHEKVRESQKKVDHLAELLNESESSNLRMTEQNRVLKEEIRRLERNQEREKHAQNLEYLKNIIMKFVTLRGGSEKERLVPVLTTMLKLSPEEKKDLEAVVTGEGQQDTAAVSSWGGYLPRWTGLVG
ncbi:uncharacterized protein LOC144114391 isoform X3 [Amblyomma americanum]